MFCFVTVFDRIDLNRLTCISEGAGDFAGGPLLCAEAAVSGTGCSENRLQAAADMHLLFNPDTSRLKRKGTDHGTKKPRKFLKFTGLKGSGNLHWIFILVPGTRIELVQPKAEGF